jgi:hypothetical protein
MSRASYLVKGVVCLFTGLILVVLVCVSVSSPVWAQAETATITGTVTDTSNAALVGAKVKATNVATNVGQATVTDSQGRYSIPALPVGTYSVEATQPGFQTVVQSGITLSVGATVVVNLSLPVGEVSQTVSVESQVSQVQTQTSSVSTLISPQQMRQLPLNGRNFEQLLSLAPGVTTIAPALNNFVVGRLYGAMNNYSVAGSRPTGQMFLLDGTDIRDFWEHATGSGYAGTSLGVEAIGEFRVLTNTYDAQFGGNGAVMNAVSRSGTNNFHGGAYEFIRNSRLDALDAPDKIAGLTTPPPFKRNQFGGDIGGPIKKDKVFFFGNYEGLRQGLETTTPLNLPEPYLAAGLLPCYDIYGNAVNTAPASGSCPGTPAGSQAAGGTTPVPVGNATIDPILPVTPRPSTPQLEQIASLYSLCNGCRTTASTLLIGSPGNYVATPIPAGTDLGGYYSGATAPNLIINEDYVLGRVDYTMSPTDNMFARYVFDDARIGDNPRDPLGIFPEKDFTRNQFLTITENHVFSATMINSLRFGYVRNNEHSNVQTQLTAAQISSASAFAVAQGGPAFTTDPLDLTRTLFNEPQREDGQLNAGTGTVLIPPVGPDQNRPDQIVQSKFSGGDDLSWTHGGHSLKLGVVVTRVQTNNDQAAYANGTLYFAAATQQQYLQGSFGAGFAVPPGFADSTRYFREIQVHPYIEDDWKVTPQLTLNLGFRYDFGTNAVGWAAGNASLTSLTGSFTAPIGPLTPPTANYCAFPVCIPATGDPGSLFTPVKHVFGSNPNARNFEPRFGFAYSPFKNNKTSIRGGVGLFDDVVTARIYESGFIATPPALSGLVLLPGFPDFRTGLSGAPGEFAGVTYLISSGAPYQIQYNLNIQREITTGTVLTVGYVGSVGRHLWMQRDDNIPRCDTYPDCTALPQVTSARPTASSGAITFIPGSANACNTFATNQNDSTAPGGVGIGCYGSGAHFTVPPPLPPTFPYTPPRINGDYGSMVIEHPTSSSSYNSLQISLNRQFAHNLAGQVNYTYSHCIDNGSFATSLEEFSQLQTDSYNQRYDYENCNFDVRHNFVVNGLYKLPFQGNRFVEGWQLTTILGVHSGLPLNVTWPTNTGYDPTYIGTQWASRPNYSYAAGCNPNRLIKQAVGVGVVQWFDPNCYEAQAPGYFGNVRRNSIPGPGALSLDFSIIKDTKITESLNMQFRVEAFNIINHFNPGAPNSTLALAVGAAQPGQSDTSQSPVITPRQIQFAVKLSF